MKQSLTKLFKKMEVGKEGIKEIRTDSHFEKKKKVKENVAPVWKCFGRRNSNWIACYLPCVLLSPFHSIVHKHTEEEDVKTTEGVCFVLVNLIEVMSPIWFVVNLQVKYTSV